MAECPPSALWTPDLTLGSLEWLDDGDDFTIPNRMIRWEGRGEMDLTVASFDGTDDEVVNGTIARQKLERSRRANLQCQMNFWSDPDGTIYDNRVEGERTSWATLNALAAASKTGDGLQSFRWTPYDGATPIDFDARMMPPVKGTVGTDGNGRSVGIMLVIPDPSGLP